jgi:ankyrin repeat protein
MITPEESENLNTQKEKNTRKPVKPESDKTAFFVFSPKKSLSGQEPAEISEQKSAEQYTSANQKGIALPGMTGNDKFNRKIPQQPVLPAKKGALPPLAPAEINAPKKEVPLVVAEEISVEKEKLPLAAPAEIDAQKDKLPPVPKKSESAEVTGVEVPPNRKTLSKFKSFLNRRPERGVTDEITAQFANGLYGRNRRTPLIEALISNNGPLITELLNDNTVNVDLTSRDLRAPYHIAAERGNIDALNGLLRRGANIEASIEHNTRTTPLVVAIAALHKTLKGIADKASTPIIDPSSPFQTATPQPYLLQADKKILQQKQDTILWFLKNGAKTDVTIDKESLIDVALTQKWDEALLKTLLEAMHAQGVKCLENPNAQGERPLIRAIREGETKKAVLLLLAGAKHDHVLNNAARYGNVEIAYFIFNPHTLPTSDGFPRLPKLSNNQKCNLLKTTLDGQTPLIEAAARGDVPMLERLIIESALNEESRNKLDSKKE